MTRHVHMMQVQVHVHVHVGMFSSLGNEHCNMHSCMHINSANFCSAYY